MNPPHFQDMARVGERGWVVVGETRSRFRAELLAGTRAW
ncbi:hypothetical protein BC739_003233 [Kutzneria viridogrisea]|uniref:Uncharacterized protein n=1 Tax=Kutzneria viridogrisea TaxID=47990 RepID=A0ABR6BHI1_9PSEU|nr:hypothetical protein [Kutzneria viridogrisea]